MTKSKCFSIKNCEICDVSKFAGNLHKVDKRAKKFQCKSERINQLAQPKREYQECEVIENLTKNLYSGGEQTPMRIRMLSHPKVHKLIATRDEFERVFDEEFKDRISKLIRKSMSTVYSRMAKVKIQKPSKPHKWTNDDWNRHKEWLKSRSLPKKEHHVQHVHKAKSDKFIHYEDLLASMFRLAHPKHPVKKFKKRCGYKSTVEKTALSYMPTERILKLAKNIKKENDDEKDIIDPFQVNPNALKFKPTKRLEELAKPKVIKIKDEKFPLLTPFGVMNRALRATTSQRTLELAKPKIKDDDEDDEEKPAVNPKALKAKTSKRVIELAKPRVYSDLK